MLDCITWVLSWPFVRINQCNVGKPTERNSRYTTLNSVFNYFFFFANDRLETGKFSLDYSIWTEKENYKLFPNGFYRKLLLKLIFNQIFQIVWLSGEHALLPSSTPISGYRLHIVLWLAWMLPRLAWILLRLACLWLNFINGKVQLYDIGWNVYSLQMLYMYVRAREAQ